MPAQLFADSNKSRVFTEFPGQVKAISFALEMGIAIRAVLYVQGSL